MAVPDLAPSVLEDSAAAALVAAAAGAVGLCPADPAGASAWEGQVRQRAFDLLRLVPAVVERSALLAACRPVTGVIASVEEVKGRGVITSHATMGVAQRNQEVVNGRPVEHFRTAFLNEAEGRAMFDLASSMVGRHCRFGKRVEAYIDAGGQAAKVSMVEWIEDLGPDPEASAPAASRAQRAPRASRPIATPPAAPPVDLTAGALCSDSYRKAILAMARQLSEPQREAFIAWMKANNVPPLVHPALTAEQAARARAFLAHIDDVAGAA